MYVNTFAERRHVTNEGILDLPTDQRREYAYGFSAGKEFMLVGDGDIDFCSMRLGYFRQVSRNIFAASIPESHVFQGMELSCGYKTPNNILFGMLIHGGSYGPSFWKLTNPENRLSSLIALSLGYSMSAGGRHGIRIEPYITFGVVTSESLHAAFGVAFQQR